MESPTGIPPAFPDHLKLMYDLQVIAFQTDMTRMITFMTGPEQSNRTYREIGIPDVHHSLSHHQSDPEKLEKLARIDAYHLQLLTYYLDKLRTTPDQDGRSLFDNMIIMYGSSISDGNSHSLESLPILLLGGGSGGLKGGRHLHYTETPVSNLYLTLLDKLDIPVENFGASTGTLDLLSIS